MIRHVCTDLERVGTELARRAGEVSNWLDERAAAASSQYRSAHPADEHVKAAARVDLACYQALTSAMLRLTSAASALAHCANDMRAADAENNRSFSASTDLP
ncbi:MAG TPA: hypothetical protein VFE65_31580 [Pseudonocardia sp.]|nr:hypothetical protein [Pseudonocardia sp.]